MHAHTPILLLVLIVVLATGCADGAKTAEAPPPSGPSAARTPGAASSGLAEVKARGSLIVGTAITKPFEFHDPTTNQLVGLDVDIATALAARLGVKIEFREMPFASLIPSVQTDKVDMTIAAMHVTDDRRKIVDFADPYMETGLVMVVRPELQGKVRQDADLKGMRVGVKIGATGDQLAQDLVARGIRLERKEYKETLESLLDLEFGRIDVVFNDYLNTLAYLKDRPSKVQIAIEAGGGVKFLSHAGFGIALRKGNRQLLEAVDAAVRQMKADGTIRRLQDKWLAASR